MSLKQAHTLERFIDVKDFRGGCPQSYVLRLVHISTAAHENAKKVILVSDIHYNFPAAMCPKERGERFNRWLVLY
jgi:hypothetical protein